MSALAAVLPPLLLHPCSRAVRLQAVLLCKALYADSSCSVRGEGRGAGSSGSADTASLGGSIAGPGATGYSQSSALPMAVAGGSSRLLSELLLPLLHGGLQHGEATEELFGLLQVSLGWCRCVGGCCRCVWAAVVGCYMYVKAAAGLRGAGG